MPKLFNRPDLHLIKALFQLGLHTADILGAKSIEIKTAMFAAKIDRNQSFLQKSTHIDPTLGNGDLGNGGMGSHVEYVSSLFNCVTVSLIHSLSISCRLHKNYRPAFNSGYLYGCTEFRLRLRHIRNFSQIRPNSASAKFLAEFGRRQCNCSAFSLLLNYG